MKLSQKFSLAAVAVIMLMLCFMSVWSPKTQADDCLVAYQIAYQDAYDQCMAGTTDTGYCAAQATNIANDHMGEIGCPPIMN